MGGMCGGMDGGTEGWMDARMDGRMGKCLEGQTAEQRVGQTDRWGDGGGGGEAGRDRPAVQRKDRRPDGHQTRSRSALRALPPIPAALRVGTATPRPPPPLAPPPPLSTPFHE